MDYQDYLASWELRFGDADKGEYDCFIEKKRHKVKVHRLSEEEFGRHLKALNQASDDFDDAFKADCGDAMKKALEDAFEHEMVLLI